MRHLWKPQLRRLRPRLRRRHALPPHQLPHLPPRNTAVYPKARQICRHDPASGRTEDLRSCPGSFARWQPGPGEPGYWGDEPTLFEMEE